MSPRRWRAPNAPCAPRCARSSARTVHSAPSSAALREIVGARKLRFDVEVREGERVIGVGTHERRTVQRAED
jgi:hypothetical protein